MAEVIARGLRFHVQRLGHGQPAVLFLHGVVMDNLSSWYFSVAPAVAEVAPVLLYDLRGHGRSERPPDGYGVADMVADLEAVLDAVGVDRPLHIVGNSFGGLLALAFALAHPDRVASLVLVDAHVSDEGFGQQMAATLKLQGEARLAAIAEHFSDWLGRHSERKRNRLASTARALVEGTSLVADLQASVPFDRAALGSLPHPVLAIYGEHSDIRHRGEDLAATLPRCELRILPGCSHSVLWEATAEVRAAVVAWIRARTEAEHQPGEDRPCGSCSSSRP
ncbi:MAG: alpha/beta hydrolase [Deltaproteobacteria bacterium]|nr:MAG: alpha/beta hydrolase [Deltaproteobacteria bacterium]